MEYKYNCAFENSYCLLLTAYCPFLLLTQHRSTIYRGIIIAALERQALLKEKLFTTLPLLNT
jgi:hypothetical protein